MRILRMPAGLWGTPTQAWLPLDMPAIYDRVSGAFVGGTVAGGYHVESISRWCLPDEDRAQFYIDTGLINGSVVSAQDLSNQWVRIQVQNNEDFPNGDTIAGLDSGWKTVFVGYVIYQTHNTDPGNNGNGRTTYYCAGALSRTRMWPLDRHATALRTHNKGHPGYNVPLHGWFRRVLGNKGANQAGDDPFGDIAGPPDLSSYYWTHALPTGATGTATWSDADCVKHAVVSSRAAGEPLFTVDLSAGIFDGAFAWAVSAGDSCFDLLRRICNRQRGRGSVYLGYQDADDDFGNVTLVIRAKPSHVRDITYNVVATAGATELLGVRVVKAATAGEGGTAVEVDLVGDHRIVGEFTYDNRESSVYDTIVVQGEQIQVLCNLNFFGGSLTKRWTAADEAEFDALPAEDVYKRTSARWRHVWRRYGIPQVFDYTTRAVPSGTISSINYICNNFGDIVTVDPDPTVTGDSGTSPMTLRFLSDLPIYEGWNYAAQPPVRWDASEDYLPPPRLPPVVMYQADANAGSDPTWFPLTNAGFNIQTDDFGLLIVKSDEDATGVRYLATSAAAKNSYRSIDAPGVDTVSGLSLSKLNTIVGVELGARVQIVRSSDERLEGDFYNGSGRRLLMTVNGIHLWVGAPGAIWELDYARAAMAQYPPGLPFPGSEPYVIRDDRDSLSFISALAWEYYGSAHNPGTWTLADCGLMDEFDTAEGAITYPTLGDVVSTVAYAPGEKATLNTPVTSIHYDHEAGTTTWRTDYVSYDGNVQ